MWITAKLLTLQIFIYFKWLIINKLTICGKLSELLTLC
jgi:hypothetical protein